MEALPDYDPGGLSLSPSGPGHRYTGGLAESVSEVLTVSPPEELLVLKPQPTSPLQDSGAFPPAQRMSRSYRRFQGLLFGRSTGTIRPRLPPESSPGWSGSGQPLTVAAAPVVCAVETPDHGPALIVFRTLALLTILIIQIYLRTELLETQLVN